MRPARIQRDFTWTAERLDADSRNTGGTFGEFRMLLDALRRYGSTRIEAGADSPRLRPALDRIIEWADRHITSHPDENRTAAVRETRDAAVDEYARVERATDTHLQALSGITYRAPNRLSEADARSILERITEGDNSALNGLAGRVGTHNPLRKVEWGIGHARNRQAAYYIVEGDASGVGWGSSIEYLAPIAHAHPYWKSRQAKGGRDSRGAISVATKEIADGHVEWTALITPARANDRLKIFPSASDIAYPAAKGMTEHSVYTTYAVLRQGPNFVIANPDLGGARFAAAPRLNFDLIEIRADPTKPDLSYATLVAREGAAEFWRHRVQGDMSQFRSMGGVLSLR